MIRLIDLLEDRHTADDTDEWIDPQVPWEQILADLQALGLLESRPRLVRMLEESRVELIAKQTGLSLEVLGELLKADPTNGKYLTWIAAQVKAGNLVFPEDAQKTMETLTAFDRLKVKKAFQGEKDVNRYADFSTLWDTVQANSDVQTKGEQEREAVTSGVKLVAGDKENGIYLVTTAEAGAKMFRGTAWCVKDPHYFNNYVTKYRDPHNGYFMIVKGGKQFALYHEGSSQFKIISDANISLKIAYQFTDLLLQAGAFPPKDKLMYKLGRLNTVIQTLAVIAYGDGDDLDDFLRHHGLIKNDSAGDSETYLTLLRSALAAHNKDVPWKNPKKFTEQQIVDAVAWCAATSHDLTWNVIIVGFLQTFGPEVYKKIVDRLMYLAETNIGGEHGDRWEFVVDRLFGRIDGRDTRLERVITAALQAGNPMRVPDTISNYMGKIGLITEWIDLITQHALAAPEGWLGIIEGAMKNANWQVPKALEDKLAKSRIEIDAKVRFWVNRNRPPEDKSHRTPDKLPIWPELDRYMLNSKQFSTAYIKKAHGGRWPELEKILLGGKNPADHENASRIIQYWTYVIGSGNHHADDPIPSWPEAAPILGEWWNTSKLIQFNNGDRSGYYFDRLVSKLAKREPGIEPSVLPRRKADYAEAMRMWLGYAIKHNVNIPVVTQVVEKILADSGPEELKKSFAVYQDMHRGYAYLGGEYYTKVMGGKLT